MNLEAHPAPEILKRTHEPDEERCEVVQIGAETVRGERGRTLKLKRELPKGIAIGEREDGRRKPYFLRSGTLRKVTSYSTERERNDVAADLWAKQKSAGVGVLDEFEGVLWRKMSDVLKRTGATPDQLEQAWEAAKHAKESAKTVSEAVSEYVRLRLSEDITRDSDTHRHLKKHLEGRLCAEFGHLRLHEVTSDRLREWFAGLKNPKTGKPMSKVTTRNHRKDVHTFFKRCVDEEWAAKNPCAKVKPPKVLLADRPPMPVKDVFQLLKANRDEAVVARLALELFGSLRASSAGRCQAAWIQWERKAIRMPGATDDGEQQHKSGKSQFRQGHPAVLWDWLKHAGEACWTDINAGNYGHKKVAAFLRANVTNPGNGLRRSCASYQLALTKNVGPVSYLMQHQHTSTTLIYEGMATEEDARLFMAITPESVLLTWDEFVAKFSKPQT